MAVDRSRSLEEKLASERKQKRTEVRLLRAQLAEMADQERKGTVAMRLFEADHATAVSQRNFQRAYFQRAYLRDMGYGYYVTG